MSEKIVKPRLTNFGDGPISDWHRETLGYDMPCLNIDSLFIEYDVALPSGLIEWKHQNAKRISQNHPSVRAVREFCAPHRYEIPFYTVKYAEDCSEFYVVPMNDAGSDLLRSPYRLMSEDEFVGFEQRLRDVIKIRRRA